MPNMITVTSQCEQQEYFKPMQVQNEGQGEEKNSWSWWLWNFDLYTVDLFWSNVYCNHKGLDAWQKKDQQRWDFSGYS